jgi:CRISPR-associated protein Cas1
VTPGNALLNYLYAILRSEMQLACSVVGLDPQLGVLHSDLANRPSLALDLMEPLRPAVDKWLLDYLTEQSFPSSAFREGSDGRVTLSAEIKKN